MCRTTGITIALLYTIYCWRSSLEMVFIVNSIYAPMRLIISCFERRMKERKEASQLTLKRRVNPLIWIWKRYSWIEWPLLLDQDLTELSAGCRISGRKMEERRRMSLFRSNSIWIISLSLTKPKWQDYSKNEEFIRSLWTRTTKKRNQLNNHHCTKFNSLSPADLIKQLQQAGESQLPLSEHQLTKLLKEKYPQDEKTNHHNVIDL